MEKRELKTVVTRKEYQKKFSKRKTRKNKK